MRYHLSQISVAHESFVALWIPKVVKKYLFITFNSMPIPDICQEENATAEGFSI